MRPRFRNKTLVEQARNRTPFINMNSKPLRILSKIVCLLVVASMFVVGCKKKAPDVSSNDPPTHANSTIVRGTPYELTIPHGLPDVKIPANNPLTVEKVALGKKLFFDKNLSLDRTISCATCHDPQKGWSNGTPFAEGVNGAVGTRNTPSIINVAFNTTQFWDGRAKSLEKQALGPILNPIEMAMPSEDELVARLKEDSSYVEQFNETFEDGLTADNVAKAIASFERTILAGDLPYDRYQAGDKTAMSESAIRGMELFFNKRRANCGECHKEPHFTDMKFYNTGIGMDKENPDLGRHLITKKAFIGAFKSPTLRQIVHTAPYMHDGSLATLEDVVEFYAKGGISNPNQATGVFRLRLNEQDKKDIVQFMVEGLSTPELPDSIAVAEATN